MKFCFSRSGGYFRTIAMLRPAQARINESAENGGFDRCESVLDTPAFVGKLSVISLEPQAILPGG